MIEVTLKLLIGQINAKLLKTVLLKVLKAEDVQYPDIEVVRGWVGLEVAVESGHNPLEQTRVQCLC